VAAYSTSVHRDEYEELAALHALGMLEGDERATFERHWAQCSLCRRLVEHHRLTLLVLLRAVPELEASPGHKARLIERAATELELANSLAHGDTPSVGGVARPPPRAAAVDLGGQQLTARRSADAVLAPRGRPRVLTWRYLTAVAATLVLAVALVSVAASRFIGTRPPPDVALTAEGPAPPATGATAASPAATSTRPLVSEPTPSPVLAASAPSAPASASGSDPIRTVTTFYRFLGAQRYDDLLPLLSPQLRATSPWQPSALRDRTPPGDLVVEQAQLVGVAPDQMHATVRVVVRETVPPPLSQTRHYVGTWQLVRGATGWLLDASDLQIE